MTRIMHIFFSCLIVSLMFAGPGEAQISSDAILGIWLLDEGVGDIAEDASGNGHNGTLVNAPEWITGQLGTALSFVSGSYVDCGNDPVLNVGVFSVSFWCNIANLQTWLHMVSRGRHFGSGNPGGNNWGVMMCDGRETIRFEVFNDTSWTRVDADTTLGEWHHVVATFDVSDGKQQLYHDGELAADGTGGIMLQEDKPLFIGAQSRDTGPGASFEGSIDEVGYFNAVLTPDDIETIMDAGLSAITGGLPTARSPQPADGAIHPDTWVTLSWKAGDFAVSHDVYLGDNFNDVEQATRDSDLFRSNQVTDFYIAGFPGFAYPDGLVPGTMYYWRIDEVNDADPDSPWKGDVWSFLVPPKTAYNPNPADGAQIAGTTVTLIWTPGFGAKMHTVYFGDDYNEVENAVVGVPTGSVTHNPGQLEEEKVYYWRIDEFDGFETYKGGVWTFTTPGAVGNPLPANGATDVGMAPILSWTAANTAASHEVYFGRDKDAVRNADTGSPEYKGPKTLGDESFDTGLLELGATYYWRVDEVYNGNPVRGPVWSFTVGDFLLVEDFESYTDNDADGEAIWQTWIDGFGVANNGAQVGYLLPPYAEQTIVHSGDQSMPLIYLNEAAVANSEAARTLTVRDWTVAGVEELSLWTRGDSANAAEPLYVAISNSAGSPGIVAHEDLTVATNAAWRQWRISLQTFADQGINLGNVDKIAIGLGNQSGMTSAGGTGTMYIDDIRLYRP